MHRPSSFRRLLPLGVLLAAVGCSGGLNCGSCSNEYVYGLTAATVPNGVEPVDDGARMRLSQAGLDFLQTHLRDILISQFPTLPGNPNVLAIPIGPQVINDSNPRVNLGFSTTTNGQGQPIETFQTNILINVAQLEQQLDFNFDDAANGIRLTISNLPVGVSARVYGDIDFGLGTSDGACNVVGALPGGFISNISFDLLIKPDVAVGAPCDDSPPNTECLKLDVEVTSFALGGIEIDMNNPGPCNNGSCTQGSRVCSDSFPLQDDDFECGIACGVGDFAIDAIAAFADFLEDNLNGLIRPILENAINGALEGVDGSPIQASGRFDLATAAPGILPESALDLGFSVGPTGNAFDVSTPPGGNLGMDLVFATGFEAAQPLDPNELSTVPHPCVLPITGVGFADLYNDGEFRAPDADPLTGNFNGAPYHLGASLAKAALNQTMFALYNTGSLCLEINSDAIHQLAGGQFELSAATLDLLTQGKLKQFADPNAPAVIALEPSQPPIITFGAGTVDEGHIKISWPDVQVSFYVLMFERFSRVFAVSTDISLELAVFNDPATETLQISVVNGPNIENFVENYNELLPGVSFQEVLESLIGVAFDAALGDQGLQFEYNVGTALSDALGVPIFIDFQGIETIPAADREFLNVYLSMTDTQPQPQTVSPTSSRVAPEPGLLRLPEAEDVLHPSKATLPTGEVRLDVDDWQNREYFARVDFGLWRGPLLARSENGQGVVVVKDGKLSLAGEHTIYLRSRYADDPNSLEPVDEAAVTTVHVDPVAPVVELVRDEDVVRVVATDNVDSVADLVYAFAIGDDANDEFSTDDTIDIDDLDAGVTRVSVRAKDLAGNVSKPVVLDVRKARQLLVDEREARPLGGGCAATPAQTNASAAALFALGLLGLLRRRRGR